MLKMIKLKNYQKKAVKFAQNKDKLALFMKVGTGKTYPALQIMQEKGANNVLVITTAKDSNSGKWEKHAKDLGCTYDLAVINFEKLRSKDRLYVYLDCLFDGVIVDECHRIKKSYRQGTDAKHIHTLTKQAFYVIGLTGTPSPNNYIETWNILRNLDINVSHFGVKSEDMFLKTYYNYKTILTSYGSRNIPTSLKNNMKELLISYIEKVAFRYFPDDMTHNIHTININEPVSELYNLAKKGIFKDNTLDVLSKVQKLQQLANGFYYENGEVIRFEPNYKVDELELLLVELNKPVIIVYKYTADRQEIEERLSRFDIMLLQNSQSEALNLQHLDTIIFYSPSFSYKDFEQMKARVMRLGQEKIPQFYLMCRNNTIESVIYKVLDKKGTASDLYKYFRKEDGE